MTRKTPWFTRRDAHAQRILVAAMRRRGFFVAVGLLGACATSQTAVAAAPGMGVAQGSREAPRLRLRWEADPPRHSLQAACGEVFNDGPVAAQHVRILVEELDGGEHVINSRELEVLGEVPCEGSAHFCVPEPPGAPTYRLTVTGADAMSACGQ